MCLITYQFITVNVVNSFAIRKTGIAASGGKKVSVNRTDNKIQSLSEPKCNAYKTSEKKAPQVKSKGISGNARRWCSIKYFTCNAK